MNAAGDPGQMPEGDVSGLASAFAAAAHWRTNETGNLRRAPQTPGANCQKPTPHVVTPPASLHKARCGGTVLSHCPGVFNLLTCSCSVSFFIPFAHSPLRYIRSTKFQYGRISVKRPRRSHARRCPPRQGRVRTAVQRVSGAGGKTRLGVMRKHKF